MNVTQQGDAYVERQIAVSPHQIQNEIAALR